MFQLEDDAGFQEFLEVHQNVGAKPVWTNDGGKTKKSELEMTDKTVDSDDSDDDSEDDDMSGSDDEEEESQGNIKIIRVQYVKIIRVQYVKITTVQYVKINKAA